MSAYTNSAVDVGGRASLLQNVAIGSPLTELGGNGSYPSPGLGKPSSGREKKLLSASTCIFKSLWKTIMV